ncbi:hypothetical protein ARALYDRAFT_493376, partial [Arabidopsis lyrata subsp. lyrata]
NSNNDWSHFYNNQTFFTTATSTVTTTTTTTSADSPLNPESRRVTKPTRRRSRASRRTPTTLFNTDTANFRAMVQQFTGGPSAVAFGSSSSSGFSLTSSDPTAGASSSPWQYANLQNHTSHHHELPQQDRPYLFSSSNHVSTLGYPNAVVSNGFVAADESKDGGGGGGYAPSSETNSNIRNV